MTRYALKFNSSSGTSHDDLATTRNAMMATNIVHDPTFKAAIQQRQAAQSPFTIDQIISIVNEMRVRERKLPRMEDGKLDMRLPEDRLPASKPDHLPDKAQDHQSLRVYLDSLLPIEDIISKVNEMASPSAAIKADPISEPRTEKAHKSRQGHKEGNITATGVHLHFTPMQTKAPAPPTLDARVKEKELPAHQATDNENTQEAPERLQATKKPTHTAPRKNDGTMSDLSDGLDAYKMRARLGNAQKKAMQERETESKSAGMTEAEIEEARKRCTDGSMGSKQPERKPELPQMQVGPWRGSLEFKHGGAMLVLGVVVACLVQMMLSEWITVMLQAIKGESRG